MLSKIFHTDRLDMSERAPSITQGSTELTPIVAIGGLLSVKQQWPFYAPLLKDSSCELGIRNRFFAIPDRGLGTIEETYGKLEEKLIETHERLDGQRAVLAGHSLGGLMTTMLALEHPDKVSDAVCMAGLQEGIKYDTLTTHALRLLLRHPPGEEDIGYDSDFMTRHKERIAKEWSPDTSLHLVSPSYDDLLLHPQGLRVELPDGQKSQKRVVGPPLPGAEFVLRRIPGMPKDVKLLGSPILVGHIDLVISWSMLRYARGVRQGGVAQELQETAIPVNPAILPLAA
ncbi:MAG TPA: alpha/beta hydrolase [Candidatus Saccharimonadales bacterium]|nr:alpha/beta hydrolase [Candidatus Saccharimonadales bacterium]